MLRPRTFLSTVRQTPLQRGYLHSARSWAAPVRRIPQLGQRSQQARKLSHAVTRKSIPVSRYFAQATRASSWRKLESKNHSPLRTAFRRAYSSEAEKPAQGVRDKFKELSRKYGWAAVGVYFGLSALDFPFCFLAVRLIGPDRIGEVEHRIVDWFWHLVAVLAPSMRPEDRGAEIVEQAGEIKEDVAADAKRKKEEASIWTQLLLAYGLHKSLLIFRVPLTAAVTPKIVKTLRGWGYNIGPRVKKPKVD